MSDKFDITKLRKPQLIEYAQSLKIATNDPETNKEYTVARLREKIREAEASHSAQQKPTQGEPNSNETESDTESEASTVWSDTMTGTGSGGDGNTGNQPNLTKDWNISYDGEQNAVEFLERLQDKAESLSTDKDLIVKNLEDLFKGKAALWYANAKGRWTTWESFIAGFKLSYLPSGYETDLIESIIARKQKYRERFIDYSIDIETLMRRYGKYKETEKLDRIYENLASDYKMYIKRRDFTTWEDLVKLCKDYEKINEGRFDNRQHQRNNSYVQRYREASNRYTPRNNESNQQRVYIQNYNEKTCCWSCGKPGHSRAQCRGVRKIFCGTCGRLGVLSRNCCRAQRQGQRAICNASSSVLRDDNRLYSEVHILSQRYNALIDTGSTASYINKEVYDRVIAEGYTGKKIRKEIALADNTIVTLTNSVSLPMCINGREIVHHVYVLPTAPIPIIGMDLIKRIGLKQLCRDETADRDAGIPHASTASVENNGQSQFHINKGNPQVKKKELKLNCDLSPQERNELQRLLTEEFAKCEKQPKGNTWIKHRIKLKHTEPIKQKYYPRNPKLQSIINEHVDKMLEDGIIEKSSSPYSSPIVLARKESTGDEKKYRFCIDFREINKISEKDAYPLPQIDDTLEKLQNAKYFSKLDLKNGYWNVALEEESKPATAFTVPGRGLYHFRVMPFGLHSSGATFQRLLDMVISPELQPNAYVYLDDIIVCSPDFQSHLTHLKEIFKRLREAGLTINQEKCEFCKTQVEYLGHVVTREGIKMNEKKIEAVIKIKQPVNAKEVRRFIGMTSWYRKFIPEYASITAPLVALLKKGKRFQWNEDQEKSFNKVKQILTSDPVLIRADFNKPFILQTDASDTGLGAVLIQEEKGIPKVVMYASRSLNSAEMKYSTTERECLAVVWGIRKMRAFLEGYHFTVITDHQALKWLNTIQNPTGRLARWALELQQYSFEIEYRSGSQNKIADELSRSTVCTIKEQEKNWYEKKLNECRTNADQCENYRIEGDQLYRKITSASYGIKLADDTEWKLCVPPSKKREILIENHDNPSAGHGGTAKTLNRIAQRYYWPGMYRDTAQYVAKCITCQKQKPSQQAKAGLMYYKNTGKPWQTITTDLIGPLPRSSQGYCWIIVFHDKFTKWTEIRPLRTATTRNVLKALKECIIMRYGAPEVLLSDNGRQFTSKQFTEEMEKYGITHRLTAPYSPHENPTERVNRTLETMISAYITSNHKKWDEHLPELNFAINTSKQETTKYTPAFLMFGRELRVPGDKNKMPVPAVKDNSKMNEIYDLVQTHQKEASNRQKQYYDKQRREWKPIVGSMVMKRDFPLSNASKQFCAKLAPKYTGPYRITREISPVIFEIQDIKNRRKTYTVHTKDLKTYIE